LARIDEQFALSLPPFLYHSFIISDFTSKIRAFLLNPNWPKSRKPGKKYQLNGIPF